MADGARLLELSQRAAQRFENQPAAEKRRLLKLVLSNCSWKNGELFAEFRQPFAQFAVAAKDIEQKKAADRAVSDLCVVKGG
jgi:hypothetical protein